MLFDFFKNLGQEQIYLRHGLYLQIYLRRGLYLRIISVVHDWWKQGPILQCPFCGEHSRKVHRWFQARSAPTKKKSERLLVALDNIPFRRTALFAFYSSYIRLPSLSNSFRTQWLSCWSVSLSLPTNRRLFSLLHQPSSASGTPAKLCSPALP
jgi:hypothetical protein